MRKFGYRSFECMENEENTEGKVKVELEAENLMDFNLRAIFFKRFETIPWC